MSSNAVGAERVSRVVGYDILKGNTDLSSPNLPQRIAVFGEANHANQSDLDLAAKVITSAKQAGELYGYGSPIHMQMRILRPISGDGVGGIPTVVYPQAEAPAAAAKVLTVTPVGVATGNGTHYLKVAGRDSLDGSVYAINILEGDTVADIADKIEDAINNVLGCPMTAVATQYLTTLTSKWRGLTANALSVTVDTGEDDLGLSYVVSSTQSGSGTPDIAAALALFGNVWNTIVLNAFGTVTTVMDALEAFNGRPRNGSTAPTGRYTGIIMKPFIALTGSVADDPSAITDARKDDVTISICPAPGSAGLPLEASANACVLYAVQAQNSPHLDTGGQSYPDMPTPISIGSMADYNNRDLFVKKGCSTVDLVNERYQVQELTTTYHPVGEEPPQFRYVRNLNIDFNIRYTYYLNELANVIDHTIANDDDLVEVSGVVKPKQWTQVLYGLSDNFVSRGLTVNTAFMQKSIAVGISSTNPDRFETSFKYKRSGIARITATDAEANFNFGTLN